MSFLTPQFSCDHALDPHYLWDGSQELLHAAIGLRLQRLAHIFVVGRGELGQEEGLVVIGVQESRHFFAHMYRQSHQLHTLLCLVVSEHLHQEGQTPQQFRLGQEAILAGVQGGTVGHLVVPLQRLHWQ